MYDVVVAAEVVDLVDWLTFCSKVSMEWCAMLVTSCSLSLSLSPSLSVSYGFLSWIYIH
jgi:hypothetical protein